MIPVGPTPLRYRPDDSTRAGTPRALPQGGDVGLRPSRQILGLRPMQEKKGRGQGGGPGSAPPARPGAHLPQRHEVVAPSTEPEAQQLVAQLLREGRARQEARDDAVRERGRFHRRRLCKGNNAGEGRSGRAAAGPARGSVGTVAQRLPAGPGRRRPLPQRRVPEGAAQLGARLPLPALLPQRRRRGPAPLGAHG